MNSSYNIARPTNKGNIFNIETKGEMLIGSVFNQGDNRFLYRAVGKAATESNGVRLARADSPSDEFTYNGKAYHIQRYRGITLENLVHEAVRSQCESVALPVLEEETGTGQIALGDMQKADVFAQVCADLFGLHKCGYAHGDVHPDNICIGINNEQRIVATLIDLDDVSGLQSKKRPNAGHGQLDFTVCMSPYEADMLGLEYVWKCLNLGESLFWDFASSKPILPYDKSKDMVEALVKQANSALKPFGVQVSGLTEYERIDSTDLEQENNTDEDLQQLKSNLGLGAQELRKYRHDAEPESFVARSMLISAIIETADEFGYACLTGSSGSGKTMVAELGFSSYRSIAVLCEQMNASAGMAFNAAIYLAAKELGLDAGKATRFAVMYDATAKAAISALREAAKTGPVYAVFDAVDAFTTGEGANAENLFVESLIKELKKNPESGVRLIFTSTPDATLDNLFNLDAIIDMDDYQDADVRAYAKGALEGALKDRADYAKDVLDLIVERSSGSFLYASLICEDMIKLGAGCTSDELYEIVYSLPKKLEIYYHKRLTSKELGGIDLSEEGKGKERLALCLICWYSGRITPELVYELSGFKSRARFERFLNAIRGFILPIEGPVAIRIKHQTFSQWLRSKSTCNQLGLDFADAKSKTGGYCVKMVKRAGQNGGELEKLPAWMLTEAVVRTIYDEPKKFKKHIRRNEALVEVLLDKAAHQPRFAMPGVDYLCEILRDVVDADRDLQELESDALRKAYVRSFVLELDLLADGHDSSSARELFEGCCRRYLKKLEAHKSCGGFERGSEEWLAIEAVRAYCGIAEYRAGRREKAETLLGCAFNNLNEYDEYSDLSARVFCVRLANLQEAGKADFALGLIEEWVEKPNPWISSLDFDDDMLIRIQWVDLLLEYSSKKRLDKAMELINDLLAWTTCGDEVIVTDQVLARLYLLLAKAADSVGSQASAYGSALVALTCTMNWYGRKSAECATPLDKVGQAAVHLAQKGVSGHADILDPLHQDVLGRQVVFNHEDYLDIAQRAFEDSLEIRMGIYGEENYLTTVSVRQLARLLLVRGEQKQCAEELLYSALETRERLGCRADHIAELVADIAELHLENGDSELAADVLREHVEKGGAYSLFNGFGTMGSKLGLLRCMLLSARLLMEEGRLSEAEEAAKSELHLIEELLDRDECRQRDFLQLKQDYEELLATISDEMRIGGYLETTASSRE